MQLVGCLNLSKCESVFSLIIMACNKQNKALCFASCKLHLQTQLFLVEVIGMHPSANVQNAGGFVIIILFEQFESEKEVKCTKVYYYHYYYFVLILRTKFHKLQNTHFKNKYCTYIHQCNCIKLNCKENIILIFIH